MTTEIFYPCGLFHISAPSDCLLKADTLFVGEQSYLWQACCMYCGHLFKLDDVRSSLRTAISNECMTGLVSKVLGNKKGTVGYLADVKGWSL